MAGSAARARLSLAVGSPRCRAPPHTPAASTRRAARAPLPHRPGRRTAGAEPRGRHQVCAARRPRGQGRAAPSGGGAVRPHRRTRHGAPAGGGRRWVLLGACPVSWCSNWGCGCRALRLTAVPAEGAGGAPCEHPVSTRYRQQTRAGGVGKSFVSLVRALLLRIAVVVAAGASRRGLRGAGCWPLARLSVWRKLPRAGAAASRTPGGPTPVSRLPA